MKTIFVICLVILAILLVPMPASQVRAQENCNAADTVNEMNGDLASYGGRVTAASDADLETLTILYFDLLDLRHRYEDRAVCDDLDHLNDLMLQIIAEMEDLSFTRMALQVNPDSSEDYDLVLDRQILARNAATYDLFLAEAANVVNATAVAASGGSSQDSSGASSSSGATSNIVSMGDWHPYRDGRFRVVGIIDPYVSQTWAQPRAGNRVIAIQMEIACETPVEGECTANSLFITDLTLGTGLEIGRGDTITLVSGDEPRFYAPQRGTPGQTFGGWVWLELPQGATYTNMTVFDWTTLREVRFSLR